jgi:hypothetical protein
LKIIIWNIIRIPGNDAFFYNGYSGFHIFCGNRISPDDETAMENLPCYIIRASFSHERMQYLDTEGGRLYSQGQKDEQGLRRSGMAGQPVLPHPQPGRTMNPVDIFSKVGRMAARRREGIPGTLTVGKGPQEATAVPRGRIVRTE